MDSPVNEEGLSVSEEEKERKRLGDILSSPDAILTKNIDKVIWCYIKKKGKPEVFIRKLFTLGCYS